MLEIVREPRSGGSVDVDAHYETWLGGFGATAVLVRPDFYVYGVEQGADKVCTLVDDFLEASLLPRQDQLAARGGRTGQFESHLGGLEPVKDLAAPSEHRGRDVSPADVRGRGLDRGHGRARDVETGDHDRVSPIRAQNDLPARRVRDMRAGLREQHFVVAPVEPGGLMVASGRWGAV